jgi:hypothetical protein
MSIIEVFGHRRSGLKNHSGILLPLRIVLTDSYSPSHLVGQNTVLIFLPGILEMAGVLLNSYP